jgi:hypothetical protein
MLKGFSLEAAAAMAARALRDRKMMERMLTRVYIGFH